MVRRLRTLNAIVVAALATAGFAAAAAGDVWPCHPDLPGTRSVTVTGQVTGYRFAGRGTVVASVQTRHCAGVARWNYTASTGATASVACLGSSAGGSPAAATKLVAAQGKRLVRVVPAPAGVDRPDRLDVIDRATGRRISSWPLIDRPARVALFGGTAILSEAGRNVLYALRLSDGRIATLGVARAGDRPIIGTAGVVYQDDLSQRAHRLAPNRVTLKLVPLASVTRQLSLADRQIETHWKITAMGMDATRVAYAVHDPSGRCDAVKSWIPPWHFVARVTHPRGPTCLAAHASGGVTNVAMAGDRLVWTVRYGNATRVLAASTIGCKEWVVSRPAPAPGGATVAQLAGDGGVLAYAVPGAVETVSAESDRWYGEVVSRSAVPVRAISVDDDEIATLYRGGAVTVMTEKGHLVGSFAPGPARAIALRGNTVAVLHSGRLDVYSVATGALTHSWPVPADARTVDLQYGIAVIAAGGDVLALNVATGRTARLLHAHGRVAAQIDSPGAVVQFNASGHGFLRFIPLSTIEARTR
ncbi:MAG TPA: hypothetical protein VHS03_06955 [Gaiellaceae bacterium]|nr:hypothetical protein [Gaiellaceae bacterium]